MKHTPGPWRVEIEDSPDAEWSRRFPVITSDEYEVVGTEGLYGDIETDIANARLIAAAPCLLQALQQIIKGVPDTWPAVEQAKAAIRKATGND